MKKIADTKCTIKSVYIPGVVEAMLKAGFTTDAMLCVAKALYKAQGTPGNEKYLNIQEVA